PGLRGVFGQHSMNTRRQWQDHDITLLPGKALQLIGGISRNTQNGPALSTIQLFNATGHEFPLFTNINRTQSEYRLGFQVGTKSLRMLVLHGWQHYDESAPITSPGSPGYNLTDAQVLTSFASNQPYSGNSPFWRGNFAFEPSKFFAINARIDY